MLLALLLAAVSGESPLWQQAQKAPVVAEVAFEGADAEPVRALVQIPLGAPLDARDVRDAVRALHASARFSRVAAFVEELEPGRVRLVFALTSVEKLVAVSFPGHAALAESILHQTADLQVNAEFQPEQVPAAVEAVRAAYYRIGYRRAQVTPVQQKAPGGISLELRVEEGPATRIEAVGFEGDTGLGQDELQAAFKLSPGDVLNLPALEEGVRGVRERYRKSGRLRARVDPPRVEERAGAPLARVVVPVSAGPLVRFHIRGNRAFSDEVVASKLAADSDEPLDAQAAAEMAGRLRRFYVSAGFYRARVAEREMIARDGAEEVVFSIDEGAQVRVEKLVFNGNEGIPTAQLYERLMLLLRDNLSRDPAGGADPALVERLGIMGTLPDQRTPRTRVEPETVFEPVLYARALKQFEDLYKSQGYLSARAGPPRLEPIAGNSNRLQVTIPIKEGEQTRVARLVVEGGGDVPAQEIDGAIPLHVGQPFSYLMAEEGRSALTQIFTRRGHLYARVEDEENFLEEGAAQVEVRYRIQPGPVVRVGYVEVVGQRRTLEGLVLDLVGLKPGDVLTPEVLDRGQQALLRTGLFFSATLTPRNPEVAESEKTVQVQLRERLPREVQASLGFSLADGPRATAQFTQANLGGRNLTFTALAHADFPFTRFAGEQNFPDPIERVIDFGLVVPRLWPLTDALRVGLDLIHQRAVQPSYDLTKYSAQFSMDLTQRRPFTAGFAYEFGFQILDKQVQTLADAQALVDQRIARLPPGQMLFGSLRPYVILDERDDPGRPRSGFLLQASGDYERSFTGTRAVTDTGVQVVHVNLAKVQGLVAGYVPLPALSSIVLSARGGRIYQLDDLSRTPGDRRFYLGGATTLRGFREEALQPQDIINTLHDQVRACQTTLSGVACTPQTQLLSTGTTSDGGDLFVAVSAELRVPFTQSFEAAVFWDAGNLWVQAPYQFLKNLTLRHAVGAGLRWLTPIGRMAIDIGVNLAPDSLLGEPQFGPYFSIDPI